jgi:uncharacterized protein YkwD
MRFNHLSFICNGALIGGLAAFLSVQALARETYVAFATRVVAQAQNEGDLRPKIEAELLRLANGFRKSNGLPGLRQDKAAHDAARAHAMDMLLHNFMGHVASTGQDFDSRMRALNGGAMSLPAMGENAAKVTRSGGEDSAIAALLFQLWVHSPAHKKTLLSRDYVSVATGVVSRGGQFYADQIFTGPKVQTNMGRVTPAEQQGLY